MTSPFLLLLLAIACEVVATSILPATNGLTRPLPSIAVVAGYAVALLCLARTVQVLPIGIVYAIWAGLGIVGVTLIGRLAYGQRLDGPALIGIGLILCGVVVINLFSTSAHP